jgi:hypothetical protein
MGLILRKLNPILEVIFWAELMRFQFSFVPFILSGCSLLAQNNQLTQADKASGWVLLFDGKTMKNWVDPRTMTPPADAWDITPDGCLHARPKPHITEDLFSASTYRDFELSFEWKISPAGNSGLKYRIQDHRYLRPREGGEKFELTVQRTMSSPPVERSSPVQDYVIGFEYQITDNDKNSDAVHAGPKHSTGALYDMVAPANAQPKPVGEFNVSRIVVRGTHVEHWLNGVKVVDSQLDSPDAIAGIKKRWAAAPAVEELLEKEPKKDCPLSLQNHGDEAWFRNIKIKRL